MEAGVAKGNAGLEGVANLANDVFQILKCMKSKSGPRMELTVYINIRAPQNSTVTNIKLFSTMPIAAYIAHTPKESKLNHARARTILSKTSRCQMKKI